MKLLPTFLVFFVTLSFNSAVYSSNKDNYFNNQVSAQQIVNQTKQSESEEDEDSEC